MHCKDKFYSCSKIFKHRIFESAIQPVLELSGLLSGRKSDRSHRDPNRA